MLILYGEISFLCQEVRGELGCCTHADCLPGNGMSKNILCFCNLVTSAEVTARCSQQLASKLQPCMQESYEGNRSVCVEEVTNGYYYLEIFFFKAVGEQASDVCQNMSERCCGLGALIGHIQMAKTLSVSFT